MTTNTGAFCTSCDRFIGPAGACPYCGADSPASPAVRVLRRLVLPAALVGLGILYLAASRGEPLAVKVGDITPLMNSACVRIAGIVEESSRDGKWHGRDDYLSFVVADDSGRIRVSARGAVARELAGRGLVPRRGEKIEAAGVLGVAAGREPKLYLRSAEQLRRPGLPAGEEERGKP